MVILGVSHPMSANPGACILVDGILVAFAEEERFVRIKHAQNFFPELATQFCLQRAGLLKKHIDVMAVGFEIPKLGSVRTDDVDSYIKGTLATTEISRVSNAVGQFYHTMVIPAYARKEYYDHHVCHAASAFVASGFDQCNVITLDGWGGEDCSGILGVFRNGEFESFMRIHPKNSWGILYELVTQAIGFRMHSAEGKTMGLAPYGTVDVELLPDFCDEEFGLPDIDRYKVHIREKLGAPRGTNDPITEKHKNLAATVQFYYERSLVKLAKWLKQKTGIAKYALAGGVALNCTGNGELASQDFVEDVFVQPAAHDGGTALGAALLAYKQSTGHWPKIGFNHAYWGSGFSQDEVLNCLKFANVSFTEVEPEVATAEALVNDQLVGFFQGRAEVGPRALGARSILANPSSPDNLRKVNAQVKRRELWRPFAPSVLEEKYFDVFDAKILSPFMIMAFQCKDNWSKKMPAVVHVDGSARPQSVNINTNGIYHQVISNFYASTGLPAVLNTSFNLDDEPIVNSPDQALATFFRCGLDQLIIGNFLVKKKN